MRVSLRKYYKRLEGVKIDFISYRNMMEDILEVLSDKIVKDKASLVMPGIGTLGIYTSLNQFKRPKINSAESLKLRQQIIKEGKIPFSPIKDENGKNIGDNGGEPWYVYYTNDIICAWRINGINTLSIGEGRFKFYATRNLKKKLYYNIQSNPLKEAFYEVNNR